MGRKHLISRRQFMQLSSITAAGVIVSACGSGGQPAAQSTVAEPTTAPQAAPVQAATTSSTYNEAPMLAELVAQGQLPPVDERLPLNPAVLPVMETTGSTAALCGVDSQACRTA